MNKQTKEIFQLSAIIIVVLAMVLITALFRNSFTLPASAALEKARKMDYFISGDSLKYQVPGQWIFIQLGSPAKPVNAPGFMPISIQPAAFLSGSYKNILSEKNKNVILFSEDESLSVRVWTWLCQQGFTNIYILESDSLKQGVKPVNEHLIYSFKPRLVNRSEAI